MTEHKWERTPHSPEQDGLQLYRLAIEDIKPDCSMPSQQQLDAQAGDVSSLSYMVFLLAVALMPLMRIGWSVWYSAVLITEIDPTR